MVLLPYEKILRAWPMGVGVKVVCIQTISRGQKNSHMHERRHGGGGGGVIRKGRVTVLQSGHTHVTE